ncbi:hypothetical protein fugu_010501 [Takifugu bimaculatus]|uniref:HMG domain-containing protein n=1 Tax=Takifugu bimaculatus TaxID=433685 RepID=A0A4Z2CAB9_9TELE|nr:hypothetical protein fugu_010501 [Takifugu bimaculatus]
MEGTPETLLPPGDKNLEQMAKYVYHHKKLPSALPENLTQFESEIQFSKHLIPAETVCQECPGQVCLTEPVLVTDKARVVTSNGVIQDNSTFLKKCPKCDLMYHYQEWSEGLHNYNSHIILSLQLCMLLQNLIQNHSAEDGLAVVLKQTVGDMSSCGMEVLQAYLHFEALRSHECPSLLMIDLYQKGIFNMAGIEIHGMPEPLTGEVNAEEIWDSVCKEIITSGLNAHDIVYVETNNVIKEAAVSAVTTPFKLSEGRRLNKERTEQCHKAVTRFLVKTLQPLSTVESPWFRDLTKTLNPKYRPPSIDELRKTLIPSWYSAEKKRAVEELLGVTEAALTCDWWSNSAHDHYLTVNLHFIMKGQMMHKVLRTKPVYDASTAEAPLIYPILEEFGVRDKVVAVTVDNMDISINSLHIRKLKCFACILNLAAQKVFTCSSVVRWVSKIQAVLAWIKTSLPAQNILQEQQKMLIMKQQLLFQSSWDSLYLMVEQFVEQFAAIQATLTDPQVREAIEEKRLEMLTENEYQEAGEFIRILKPLYTSSLCVSAEKSPNCSQIFPILKKLEAHLETQHEDTPFTNTLKRTIWGDLSTHYKDGDTWNFLQEASALDPRFKNRIDSDEIWQRVLSAACDLPVTGELPSDAVSEHNDAEHSEEAPFSKRLRLSALEELFEAEDRALKSCADASSNVSIPTRLLQEIELYRKIPAIPTSEDPLVWWWDRRDMLPFPLSTLQLLPVHPGLVYST